MKHYIWSRLSTNRLITSSSTQSSPCQQWRIYAQAIA